MVRADASEFVPASRRSSSVDDALADVNAGVDGTPTADDDDAEDAEDDGATTTNELETLRARLRASERECEIVREERERLKAAAAQAGRVAKAYASFGDDVTRLERALEAREEALERANARAVTAEEALGKEMDAMAVVREERDAVKAELRETLRKALSSAAALAEERRAREEALAKAREEFEMEAVKKVDERVRAATEVAAREKSKIEGERDDLRAALEASNARADAARDECESVRAELASSRAETSISSKLQEELEELRRLLSEEEKKREMAESSAESAAAARAQVEDELVRTRASMEETKESMTTMTTEIASMVELKAQLERRDDELRKSREAESALSRALSEAESQILESRRKVDIVVARAEAASKIFTENAAALRLADARAATAELETSVAEEKAQTLEARLDQALEERENLAREVEELRAQLAAVPRTSPVKPNAPSDVIEALEHERRARALYQSDARYWRERFEATLSTSTPMAQPSPRSRTPGEALAIAAGIPRTPRTPRTPTTADIRPPSIAVDPTERVAASPPAAAPSLASASTDENAPPPIVASPSTKTNPITRGLAAYFNR